MTKFLCKTNLSVLHVQSGLEYVYDSSRAKLSYEEINFLLSFV